ncbi:MAG: N-acetylglucosaminyl-diphospho-decaprenol L-rhamnosyltransferase [Formosa sp. Hel1_33_131]|nr:MAG: N-acetylglucosaminyl-diphospho-decaprenol L-rhamnosyltransferase [Formosa sp. Hel1_33_131]
MKLAIVILNWNGKKLLETFLPSVIEHSKRHPIYVIDNGSTDASVPFLKTQFPTVQCIQLMQNLGYAGGYNEGLKHVNETVYCLLNSDVEVTKNWLKPVIGAFESNPNTAIIQPKILNYNDKTKFDYAGAGGGFIDQLGYPYCRGRIFNAIEKDHGQYDDQKDVFWASGACFFVRAYVFETLGGFDSKFFAHMEEIDLCWRAQNNGLTVSYIGTSTVYHVGGASLKTSNPKKTYLNFRNSLYTVVKNTHSQLFTIVFIRLVLDGIAGIRFLLQGQPKHMIAILKAHGRFYHALPYLLRFRKQHPTRITFRLLPSIVWSHFVSKISNFKKL